MSKFHAELVGTDLHDPKLHASYHEVGGIDLVDHDSLTGYVANEHIDWTNTERMILDGRD